MKTAFATLTIAALLGVAAAGSGSGKGYDWTSADAAFSISTVSLASASGAPFAAGVTCALEMDGMSSKKILAGTLKYKLYEYGVKYFVAQGNSPYFKCDNKGCDPTSPIALTLNDPMSNHTSFKLKMPYTMPKAVQTGVFRLVLWGEDQDHSPYDFSVTIDYNFTSAMAKAAPAQIAEVAAVAPTSDPFAPSWDNGEFTISAVTLTAPMGKWGAGVQGTVTMTGTVNDKLINAGTVKYKIYEYEEQYFVASGNSEYFVCDNKGCHTDQPIALHLQDPSDPKTNFTATLTFTMPKAQKSGDFKIVLWGVDQDHVPYDFDVTVGYNFTMAAEPKALIAEAVEAETGKWARGKISTDVQNGAFHIERAYLMSQDGGMFEADKPARILMQGYSTKKITAGTLQWKIYELFVKNFVDSGNSPYFQCDNKGCNPAAPIALDLEHPTSALSRFSITAQFNVPKPQKTGIFTATFWGSDQDHTPYDFSASVNFNVTMA